MKEWRKSWSSLNIHGHNGNGSAASKRLLLPEERSVWDDYLDMARLSPVPGQVCISSTVGYSKEQLAEILKTPIEVIESANKHMGELQMITVENSGIVVVNNWKMYQPDYERVKVYKDGRYTIENTPENTLETTSKATAKNTPLKEKKRKEIQYIRKEYKELYTTLFNHWNSKKIILHKYITEACYGVINRKLDHGYTIKELTQAVDNYVAILKGNQYFWSYKWTLQEFLQRGLDKFMDLDTAKKNYANRYRSNFDEEVAEGKKKFKEAGE